MPSCFRCTPRVGVETRLWCGCAREVGAGLRLAGGVSPDGRRVGEGIWLRLKDLFSISCSADAQSSSVAVVIVIVIGCVVGLLLRRELRWTTGRKQFIGAGQDSILFTLALLVLLLAAMAVPSRLLGQGAATGSLCVSTTMVVGIMLDPQPCEDDLIADGGQRGGRGLRRYLNPCFSFVPPLLLGRRRRH